MTKAIRASALVLTLAAGLGTLPAASPDKTLTTSGNVVRLQATERTVVIEIASGEETTFVWTADTKISGTLAVGAKVTIRYTILPDGQHLAHQINVLRG